MTALRTITITIPSLPPNKNKAHPNAHQERKRIKPFARLVFFEAVSARNAWEWDNPGETWETLQKASIEIRFIVPTGRKGPLPDYQNLMDGCKLAVDQLTARVRGVGLNRQQGACIFRDDGPDYLTWVTPPAGEQVVKRGQEEQTIITLREVLQ